MYGLCARWLRRGIGVGFLEIEIEIGPGSNNLARCQLEFEFQFQKLRSDGGVVSERENLRVHACNTCCTSRLDQKTPARLLTGSTAFYSAYPIVRRPKLRTADRPG